MLLKGGGGTGLIPQKHTMSSIQQQDVLTSASDKAKLFTENFSKTLILMTQVYIYLFFLLELI